MRIVFAFTAVVLAVAAGVVAQEASEASGDVLGEPVERPGFQLDLAESLPASGEDFDPWGSFSAPTANEFRLALWEAPLGRLHLQLATEQAMLGRTGLVHGGRALGVGLGSTALGDAGPKVSFMGVSREAWKEMTVGERVMKGVQVGVAVGVLGALIDALN